MANITVEKTTVNLRTISTEFYYKDICNQQTLTSRGGGDVNARSIVI
jgi:hypothetical protein